MLCANGVQDAPKVNDVGDGAARHGSRRSWQRQGCHWLQLVPELLLTKPRRTTSNSPSFLNRDTSLRESAEHFTCQYASRLSFITASSPLSSYGRSSIACPGAFNNTTGASQSTLSGLISRSPLHVTQPLEARSIHWPLAHHVI